MLHHLRLTPVPEDQWTSEQRTILETLTPYRRQMNVYRTLIRHPALAQRFFVFGHYILSESTLPPRDRELVILRVGWLCHAEYEWSRHTILAGRVGLTDEEIRRIVDGPTAPGWSPFDATLLRVVDELHETACLSDSTWTALAQKYSEPQLMDLVFTIGQYTLVSMAFNSFGVQLDPETTGFPITIQKGEFAGERAGETRSSGLDSIIPSLQSGGDVAFTEEPSNGTTDASEINAVYVHSGDSVAVVIQPVRRGKEIKAASGATVTATENIPKNHKVALVEIAAGEQVIKYGESIGIATRLIRPGDWVHVHNMRAEV